MANTPEGKVKVALKKRLASLGIYQTTECLVHRLKGKPYAGWYYMPSQNGYGEAGIWDFVGCLESGEFFSIETKAGDNTLSARQVIIGRILEPLSTNIYVIASIEQAQEFSFGNPEWEFDTKT